MALFPSSKEGGEPVNSGSKRKGVTIDPLAVFVTVANESELASIQIQTAEAGGSGQKPTNLATDGRYDSGESGKSGPRKGIGLEKAKRIWKERK